MVSKLHLKLAGRQVPRFTDAKAFVRSWERGGIVKT